ncbi:MAG: hypothetical protein WBG71_15370 [Leeuwenhoekiella sp.]
MINKFAILISLVIVGITPKATAQTVNIDVPSNYINSSVLGRDELPANVQGSPYLNEQFLPATIVLKGKELKKPLRLNVYKGVFEFKDRNGNIMNLNADPDIQVKMKSSLFQVKNLPFNDTEKKCFVETLVDGKFSFYKLYGASFSKGVVAEDTYSVSTPPRFKTFIEYFIVQDANFKSASNVRLKKKDILRYVDDPALKKYAKENNIRFKSEEEVVEALNYLNDTMF